MRIHQDNLEVPPSVITTFLAIAALAALACCGPAEASSMAATTTKIAGRFTVTGALLDFSDPGRKLNNRTLDCGTAVSMNGLYVTEMAHSHADLRIWDWSMGTLLRQFHVMGRESQMNATISTDKAKS